MSQKTGRHPNPQTVAFPNKGNKMVHGGFLLGPHFRSAQLLKFLSSAPGRPCWRRSNFPALGSHRTLNCNSFGICCAFLMRYAPEFVSLDSVGNWTQEVERSGRRSCCPSSLALAFLIKSCLAHLVMSACPQMIITPSLDALVSFEKFRTISLPFISLKSGITKPPRHSCTVVLHSPRLALLQSTDAWFDTRFIQKS